MYVINHHFKDVVYKLPFLHLFFFFFIWLSILFLGRKDMRGGRLEEEVVD